MYDMSMICAKYTHVIWSRSGARPHQCAPPPAGWVAKCTDTFPTRRKNYLKGGFCSILALDPLNHGLQCFEIVGLYLGLTNWAHNSPRWYQPPLRRVDAASNYLHPHVTSMRLVHEYHHLCKAPSIQALHWAAKLTNLTAYPPHSAQGRRTFTIHYWARQASPTCCIALSKVSCWRRNGAAGHTGQFGELIALCWSRPIPIWGGGGGPAGLDHLLYSYLIICFIMLYHHISYIIIYHIFILYLKQTATFDLPYYPKTNTSTHLLSMRPCDTIDNPQFSIGFRCWSRDV